MTGDKGEDSEWTNPSVALLAPHGDPLTAISALVTDLLLRGADAGAVGSPTDPFQLAQLMGIGLRPRYDIADARLTAQPADGTSLGDAKHAPLGSFAAAGANLVIEYNPTRPRGRLRYSVAHELAHALFPDAAEETRHRTSTGAVEELADDDSWQLELLCNVAAAELLMPTSAIEGLVNTPTDIDFLMGQRAKFHVSTEAMLRRLVHATDRPIALAAMNRVTDSVDATLRCDYVLGSRTWTGKARRGSRMKPDELGGFPSAVGQTIRGTAQIDGASWQVQAVGVPPYPGRNLPRVLALFEPVGSVTPPKVGLTYVRGDIADAADAAASEPIVIAHVVSDSAHKWGRFGVAAALATRFREAGTAFHHWSIANRDNLSLGNIHTVTVSTPSGAQVTVASLVAQAGFGPSSKPRLSYVALAEALDKLAEAVRATGASVHMPRIGSGQGGGRWDLIEATIEHTLLDRGIPVVVYTLPSGAMARDREGAS